MRTLTYWTVHRPYEPAADDEQVLDCLTDNGLPRLWESVRGVEFTGDSDIDGNVLLWEVEVYV